MASHTLSQLMAEYTVGWILNHERGWLEARQNQLQGEWRHTGSIAYRCLNELTVGVLGMGNIGKEVARSLKAFRSEVHAFTRTEPSPEHRSKDVDKYWHTGELADFLGHCDYIVNIMPSTPDTRGMLGKDAFKHAKFMAMHNITKKRIDNAIHKMTHTATPLLDLRGRHKPAIKILGRKAEQFRAPKMDTCTICDTLQMALSNATTEQEKADQQAKLDDHQREAKKAQDYMKRLQDDNDPETRAVCIDLQQILPTPKLHTSAAYYRRKLWTYNFCIHNLKTKASTMFVWDETVAKRGSIEVASCLHKWMELESAKGDFGRLVVISDNCAGQNKNINLVLMYLRELHSKRLFEVNHVYLVPGHSYMACDRAFGNIERKITNQGVIYTPDDYIDAIKNAVAAGFPVIKMTQDDFFSFGTLSKYITKREAPGSTLKNVRKILLRLAFREGCLL
ncbi:Glyoxylate reductase/hydroxypyruvate reductase [Chionoecetes opilio]|uniref:Glyoxylate reductase/hydroxypyruvate reductase n=1 Tax=Chionoecetes opilio TaxID=41210 RepID=A0A8J4YKW7_CHIOP|nr:Glyoxylate reductase/hydroxypyruvate reductase [Chionoecetes opilio]